MRSPLRFLLFFCVDLLLGTLVPDLKLRTGRILGHHEADCDQNSALVGNLMLR
jgi:hypothetical protein